MSCCGHFVTFSVKIWSKEAQGYKSNILLLLYQWVFIDVFFRKIIIEIWEINPWPTNSSINGSREQALTETVGYLEHWNKNKKMCYEISLKILLELSIDLNHSYKSSKTSVALEIYILSNLEILLEHLDILLRNV